MSPSNGDARGTVVVVVESIRLYTQGTPSMVYTLYTRRGSVCMETPENHEECAWVVV